MPPLGFNFRTSHPAALGWRIGVMTLSLFVLALVGMRAHTVLQQREAVRWHLDALRRQATPKQPELAPEKQAAMNELAMVRSRMRVSWEPVFDSLERATPPNNISLLSVNSTGLPGSLQIRAEARTLTDALGYVARLNQSHSLAQILLQHYEVKQSDPDHPISLQVKAVVVP